MDNTLPFKLGSTYFGATAELTSTTDGEHLLGQEYVTRGPRGGYVRVRAVRNSATITIGTKRQVLLNSAGTAITGYTRLASEKGPYVDDQLTAVVQKNDICFVCIRGLTLATTSQSNYSADIAAGDRLNAQTAAASTSATAGRVILAAVVAATADATAGQRNITEGYGVSARAVSAALTNATSADILVEAAYA